MIAMNDKEKIYTIVFIPPIWQDKNNNYTQMLCVIKMNENRELI
jgi:hypothetical protein